MLVVYNFLIVLIFIAAQMSRCAFKLDFSIINKWMPQVHSNFFLNSLLYGNILILFTVRNMHN